MIHHSPYPDVTIPDVALTPYLLRRAGDLADRPALVDGPTGRTLTYGQLADAIRAMAAGLADRGFGPGDVMAICCPNVPEYAIAFHAVALAGGVNTTINPLYTAGEMAFQLQDAGARFLLTIPPFLEKAREAATGTAVEEIFVLGEAAGATPVAALMQDGGDPPAVVIRPGDDLVALPYSSGTTGLPKGVMLTHRNIVANMAQVEAIEPLQPDDTLIGVLPFFHIYGLVVILNIALAAGASVVTMPRFDMEQFLELVQSYRVTWAHLVPPIVLGLAKHPAVDRYDLSSLKCIVSGAAPLGAELTQAARRRLGCQVKQGYGMTELSPVSHYSARDRVRDGAVGHAIPNTEVRIVDVASGRDLGPGRDGEIWVRGPQVMKGYLNRPDATALTITEDGWLRTGDIGHVDDDGYYYIVDRLKELIKYKGFQVAPAELEALLVAHPAIADAAVIPAADEEAGEIPRAYVVRRGDLTAEQIMSYVADHVASYKRVREVVFVDEIPKSLSGKILRRVLREGG